MPSIIRATTTSGLQVAPDNSGSLELQTNGTTTALTINTSQNVGIGTTSPTARLTFGGQTGATTTPLALRFSNDFSNGTTAASSKIIFYNDGTAGNIYGIGVGSSGDIQYHAGSTGASSGNHRWYTNDVERMRIDGSGNFTAVIPSGSTTYPAFWCRAWVNFNGTGTVAIRGSGNVSSITDNGTGDYTINFTTAMPDTNYAFTGAGTAGGAMNAGNLAYNWDSNTKTTSALRVYTVSTSYSAVDANQANVSVFR